MQAKVINVDNGFIKAIVRRNHRVENVQGRHDDVKVGDAIEVRRVTNNPFLVRVVAFSDEQIQELRREFATLERIDPTSESYRRLIAMLNGLDQPKLKQLASAGIKFVSMLATNRVK